MKVLVRGKPDSVAGSGSCRIKGGFSLVEVLLALAVVSTGILVLLQLMGPALDSLSATRRVSVADRIPATVALAVREHPWSTLLAEDAGVIFFCVLGDDRIPGNGAKDQLFTRSDLARALGMDGRLGDRVFELWARPLGPKDRGGRFVKMIEVRPVPPFGSASEMENILRDDRRQESPVFVFPVRVGRQ